MNTHTHTHRQMDGQKHTHRHTWTVFSYLWRLGRPRSKNQLMQCLVSARVLVHRECPLAVSAHCGKMTGVSQGSLYFPPNFPLSQSHLLLKVTSHNVIVLGTKSSKHEHSETYSFKEAYVVSMLQQKQLKGESLYSGLKFNCSLSRLGSQGTRISLCSWAHPSSKEAEGNECLLMWSSFSSLYSVQDHLLVPPTIKIPPLINVVKTIPYRQAQDLSSQILDSMTLNITGATQILK